MQRNGKFVLLGGVAVAVFSLAGAALASTQVPPETTFVAPERTPPPVEPVEEALPIAAFIGDSYTNGTGASDLSATRWTTLVSNALGWDEVNLGRGGTGYVGTADRTGCGLEFCPNYQGMIPDAIAAAPDVVVVAGGQNDFDEWQLDADFMREAITTVFTDIRAALPDARIIAVGPSTIGDIYPAVIGFDLAVQDAAASIGASYVSLVSPPAFDTSVATPDGSHVTDAGHQIIADRVIAVVNS